MNTMHTTRLAVAVLVALTVSLRPASAASLIVRTNFTETGVQQYDSLYVTNAATYTITGPTANVAITNTVAAIGQTSTSGSGNLVVSNGAVLFVSGNAGFGVTSPSTAVTSMVTVVGSTLNSTVGVGVGGTAVQPGQMMVTDASSMLLGTLGINDGYMLISGGSQVTTTNNGTYMSMAFNTALTTAQLDITGAGTTLLLSNSYIQIDRQGLGIVNISSGAVFTTSGPTASSLGNAAYGNTTPGATTGIVTVASGGKWFNSTSFVIGSGNTGTYTSGYGGVGLMTVEGTGSTVSGISMNLNAPTGFSSSLVISNGGFVILSGAIGVGNASVLVTSGGILQAASWATSGSGTITNLGGVYQFNTGTTFSEATPGTIVLNNGTISIGYHNMADVTNNLGHGVLSGIAFVGANTFMLNSVTNNTAGGQTYTFNAISGNPSNYASLAMVNGATGYQGGNLTIGGAGSMLISNTTASITGLFTNQGVLTLATATAHFANGVVNSGTLRGNGTIIGNVTSSGTNSPGFSVGTLAITGNLSLTNGAVTWMELAAPGSNDLIAVTGQFSFGGELTVTNSTGFTFAAGQSFQLFSFGSQTNNFAVTNLPVLVDNSLGWNTSQLNSQGILSIMTVPEPSALLLVGLGLLGLFWSRRRTPSRSQR